MTDRMIATDKLYAEYVKAYGKDFMSNDTLWLIWCADIDIIFNMYR